MLLSKKYASICKLASKIRTLQWLCLLQTTRKSYRRLPRMPVKKTLIWAAKWSREQLSIRRCVRSEKTISWIRLSKSAIRHLKMESLISSMRKSQRQWSNSLLSFNLTVMGLTQLSSKSIAIFPNLTIDQGWTSLILITSRPVSTKRPKTSRRWLPRNRIRAISNSLIPSRRNKSQRSTTLTSIKFCKKLTKKGSWPQSHADY